MVAIAMSVFVSRPLSIVAICGLVCSAFTLHAMHFLVKTCAEIEEVSLQSIRRLKLRQNARQSLAYKVACSLRKQRIYMGPFYAFHNAIMCKIVNGIVNRTIDMLLIGK